MHFDVPLPQEVRNVLMRLRDAGYEAVLVGGSVRDMLLGRSAHDYDVATAALPEAVLRCFPSAVPTGLKHGTVTVIENRMPVEVTTYRVDLGYSDGRHPDAVAFTNELVEDLSRRDFTVNAMALTVDGRLVDPFEGHRDLQKQVLRAVGKPGERFSEDALRILRALRLAAATGFTIERDTQRAMRLYRAGLSQVSTERIGQELQKMAQTNWLSVLPELGEGGYFAALEPPVHGLDDAFRYGYAWMLRHGGAPCDLHSRWERQPWSRAVSLVDPGEHARQTSDFTPRAGIPSPDSQARVLATLSVWRSWWSKSSVVAEDWSSLCRLLGWPVRWSKHIARGAAWSGRNMLSWEEAIWYKAYFEDADALWTACVVTDWMDGQDTATAKWETVRERIPIRTPGDLALSGLQLQHLGVTGPEIRRVLAELVQGVLEGALQNEERQLRRAVETRLRNAGDADMGGRERGTRH